MAVYASKELRERYAEHKHEKEISELKKSEKPLAGLAAFGSGFAGGAATPLVMNAVDTGLALPKTMEAAKTRARVEALLKSRGFPAERASAQAGSVLRLLHDTAPDKDVADSVRDAISVWQVKDPELAKTMRFPSREEALKSLGAWLDTNGHKLTDNPALYPAIAESMIESAPTPHIGGKLPEVEAKSILHAAETAFREAGAAEPRVSKVLGKALLSGSLKSLPSAVLLGLGSGVGAVALHRRNKKLLEKLHKTAAAKKRAKPQKPKQPKLQLTYPKIVNGSTEQPLATAPIVMTTKTASVNEFDLAGRRMAHYMWGELEKISAAAATAPGSSDMDSQQSGAMEGDVQQGAEGEEEASPSHGIVAARVEQLDDKKARGIPVIQPPPGFIYAPELQAFIPDESNPAWMQAEQAADAARARSFYDQGQQDAQTQMTQEAAQQQQAAAESQVFGEKMDQAMGGGPAMPKTPSSVSGKKPASGGEKPAAKTKPSNSSAKKPEAKKSAEKPAEKGKGITINVAH